MCTGEKGMSEVIFQIVGPDLVRPGGKMRQRRKCVLQLAGSSRDLARKCSATNMIQKKDGRSPFLPHLKSRFEVRKI